jgi:hypothetical protein
MRATYQRAHRRNRTKRIYRHSCRLRQECGRSGQNNCSVRAPKLTPSTTSRRPPEPFRPLPARKLGVSLLSAQARRRRYRDALPPRAGESGGW